MSDPKGPIVTKSVIPGVFRDANYYEAGPEVHLFSWCPTPDGTGPATQVHMHVGSPPGNVAYIRFKSPRTLDAVIDALIEHREDVWGKR